MRFFTRSVALALVLATSVRGQEEPEPLVCPHILMGTPRDGNATVPTLEAYDMAVRDLDVNAVLTDIVALLTDSQPCWPADSLPGAIGQSYGGLFIRLAWHCAGTFRESDRAGGCAGGNQRFPPESTWEDNTNLDKARALLYPIKAKYGDALSWGDLFVLAGTGAILHMGGPVSEICVGRVDNADGTTSLPLGPLNESAPDSERCFGNQGNCQDPFGASSVGLIYVNPEGFMGEPNLAPTANQIREIFGRMGMNDFETVALIGGGHAFGASHGACPAGPGAGPDEQPENPWPGLCGSGATRGRGPNTYTSGIEGYWTEDPFKWDNQYFQFLVQYGDSYTVGRGPGEKYQWSTPSLAAPLMMQTTDLALWNDTNYRVIVRVYAENIEALNVAFANAWFKLVDRGGVFSREKKCMVPDQRFLAAELQTPDPEPVEPTESMAPMEPTSTGVNPDEQPTGNNPASQTVAAWTTSVVLCILAFSFSH